MPAVAVAAQHRFGFVDIKTRWTQSLTLRPEGWTVVHVAQVSDFVGHDHAAIVDGPATIVNGKNAIVYVWYDNEHGYSRQVVRLVERTAGIRPPTFPR